MNPIYYRPPPPSPFDIVPIRVGKANDNSRLSARKSNMSTSAGIWGGGRKGGREREKGGGKCQEFCPRGNLSLRKVYSAIAFLFFFFTRQVHFVEIILETLR